ncbi:MAG: hypothetical protein KJS92_03435 [Bacteroidetes bacterium]|nr:hypothetical protein [Bacteroidota bacterium]
MSTSTKATETVELALQQLGVNPEEVRCSEPGQWLLFREEFEIYLDVWEQQELTPWNYFKPEGELSVFQVSVPVFYMPENRREELLEELLAVNMNLFYGAFTYNPNEQVVLLKYKRLSENLQISDVVETVEALGYYAEMTFKVLSEEFGLKAIQTKEAES